MIDIIIPAYNAHKTIKQTLLSICMQNIAPLLKVYLIDDCSDKPYDYLKDLFKDKINLTIIRNEENQGTGMSRNIGIDASNNPYLFFLDADDIIPSIYAMGNLLNTAEKEQSDIIYGRMIYQDENKEIIYIDNNNNCVSCKLYSREFIDKNKARFNKSSKHEDTVFHNLLLLAKPKVSHIKNDIYFYRYNKDSVTHNDPDYLYRSLKELAKNNIWFALEAEKREFNKVGIAKYLFHNVVYSYYVLLSYLDDSNIEKAYRDIFLFVTLYLSYDKFLYEEEKWEIFYGHVGVYKHIPPITFYDFLDRVKNSMTTKN